ncbi:hypothetical protein RRG08_065520 [Elysia crispata]|uniref:Uncharacterized protein n=1 Tax=Elysia crispata TaxID=231223 RepID=A0AAE0Z5X7_9GAST|nr:hypothetical protein RRG08_065520 [Elysia crispata]
MGLCLTFYNKTRCLVDILYSLHFLVKPASTPRRCFVRISRPLTTTICQKLSGFTPGSPVICPGLKSGDARYRYRVVSVLGGDS